VTFFNPRISNREVTVGPDGEIYLPLVGRVTVVGSTVDDVTREITEGYKKEMINPQITVSVDEFAGLEVYVSGEVNTPGMQPYRGGRHTLAGDLRGRGLQPQGTTQRGAPHSAGPRKQAGRYDRGCQGNPAEGPAVGRYSVGTPGYCLRAPQEDRQRQHFCGSVHLEQPSSFWSLDVVLPRIRRSDFRVTTAPVFDVKPPVIAGRIESRTRCHILGGLPQNAVSPVRADRAGRA